MEFLDLVPTPKCWLSNSVFLCRGGRWPRMGCASITPILIVLPPTVCADKRQSQLTPSVMVLVGLTLQAQVKDTWGSHGTLNTLGAGVRPTQGETTSDACQPRTQDSTVRFPWPVETERMDKTFSCPGDVRHWQLRRNLFLSSHIVSSLCLLG